MIYKIFLPENVNATLGRIIDQDKQILYETDITIAAINVKTFSDSI
jgi:hypothetical protein